MGRISVVAAVALAAASLVPVALAKQSPKPLLASILAKARAQHSVHYVSWQSEGASGKLVIRADVARDRGVQHVTDVTVGKTPVRLTIVVVATTAYVRGGKAGLEKLVGLRSARAERYAGRWISIPSGDRLYRLEAAAVTLRSFLQEIEPRGRLRAVFTTIKGTKVIEIRGETRDGETVLAARRLGRLPIAASDVAAGGMGSTKMSDWNEPVRVQAPAHAVPIPTVRG